MVQSQLLVLLTSLVAISVQQAPSTPSQAPLPAVAIGGSGPPPAPITTASVGSWKPPSASGGLPPPSLTGMGRQIRLNSATDFCLLMPPDPTKQNLVDAEADAVAYCTNPVNGTRPIPDGFIKTAHFRHTDKYVQISGTYDPKKMNLSPNDCGGEYDNHGAMGVGNPVGAAVDGAQDFMQFMGGCDIPGNAVFCMRACHGPDSYEYCKNTYDLMGCLWVMPGGEFTSSISVPSFPPQHKYHCRGAVLLVYLLTSYFYLILDYETSGFSNCNANFDLPVGAYPPPGPQTFHQGDLTTPLPVAAPASSACVAAASPAPLGVTYYWAGGAPAAAAATGAPTSNSKNSNSGSKDAAKTGAASSRRTAIKNESHFFPAVTTIALCAGLLMVLAV
ncbi:hypothetical protein MJO29_013493 [Puccinia striiformis f. sp. tritici]|uniref:Uncharacterized protein n=2 Tax=Puccinia striiformis TaxID=27350 RepID=A0A2S4UDR5_9BASI|nr:hypothetical protein Pst134EB_026417 [Puccinia striiformis f. sp. tritici]KAI7941419.1 hypothetical protein MJO29_013493 [Puccinia striiformis f. sp. tritici]POV95422.1 hypothetical protein PSHT_15665 [Puccinia striiformis]POW14458.1 hypothetical protein PSTT_02916 [Puccinia striiformis]